MKPAIGTILLIVVLALIPNTVVHADGNYLADAVFALQHGSVYVAPNTEGTNSDTSGVLSGKLGPNSDNIVLVMFPASAESELGASIDTIASRLSEMLGNQRIIGLSVGRKVVGFAPMLPAGVASDQMHRADSVSNDAMTALVTYVQNIRLWLRNNAHAPIPTPKPTPTLTPVPTPQPQKGGTEDYTWVLWLVVPLGVITLFGMSLVLDTLSGKTTSSERTRFQAPTNQVGDLLTKIAQLRSQVQDEDLQQAITNLCKDTEKYFKKYCSDPQHDAKRFEEYLKGILEVLNKYLEVQNEQRYYREPAKLLQTGKEAVKSFADYVLTSCQNGSEAKLMEFQVNSKILSAQRYR